MRPKAEQRLSEKSCPLPIRVASCPALDGTIVDGNGACWQHPRATGLARTHRSLATPADRNCLERAPPKTQREKKGPAQAGQAQGKRRGG